MAASNGRVEEGHASEAVINVVHKAAPGAAIAFNTTPGDSANAAARWLVAGIREADRS